MLVGGTATRDPAMLPVNKAIFISLEGVAKCSICNGNIGIPASSQVFSKRLTYNKERNYFDIDPPLQSSSNLVSTSHSTLLIKSACPSCTLIQVLDEPSVVSWVHSRRLPLFWDTDLHLECRLCREVLQDNEGGHSNAAY